MLAAAAVCMAEIKGEEEARITPVKTKTIAKEKLTAMALSSSSTLATDVL
jgi:hypothetical protein